MTNKLTYISKLNIDAIVDKLTKKYAGRKSFLNAEWPRIVYRKVRDELLVDVSGTGCQRVKGIIDEYSSMLDDLANAERRVKEIKSEPLYRPEDWE